MGIFGGKLNVLETKISIYEELSKDMLDKLERAVGTISDNSNKVAVILERHEGRLDDSDKTDALLLKMFEEMKLNNSRDHQNVATRINKLEKKIDEIIKFRWITVGIALAAMTLLKSPEIFGNFLTPNQKVSMIGTEISVPYERS
jgi:ribosome-associated translation inhibitor RaiA